MATSLMPSRPDRPHPRGVLFVAACVASHLAVSAPAQSPTPARGKPIVDRAVVPAGGLHCRHCGPGICRGHGGHLDGCRDGLCAPHCPVRPSQYGFYSTQWRRWPGQGVVQTSAEEAATPAAPPPFQVPSIEEESPRLPDTEPAPPDDVSAPPADPLPEPTRRPVRPAETGEPAVEPPAAIEPDADAPAAKGVPETDPADAQLPVPPTPPGEPPVPPADATLIDPTDVKPPLAEEPVEAAGAMRYPAAVGRSVAAGNPPWRLRSARPQRADDSARGL